MVGRPSLGERRQVNVRLPIDLVAEVDAARGGASRDRWFEEAARHALKPTSVYQNPELRQEIHEHRAAKPKRTVFKDGQRIRIYECECGIEVVAR